MRIWKWDTELHRGEKELLRRVLILFCIPLCLVIVGTVGYYFLEEEYSAFDALYMTVITLTTVGYLEIHDLSSPGRVFTIFLLLGGVFSFFYSATEILRAVIGGQLQDLFGRQRMERTLASLSGHFIVCGFGRMGRFVAEEFAKQHLPFVVIDRRAELFRATELHHGLTVVGDATADEVLRRAGVERARALITVVRWDADNLYITMSARLLNDKLYIVARAEEEDAEKKLLRAGANRVVAPYAIGGSKVAQAVLRPNVVEFIELATRAGHLDLQIEETQIRPSSKLVGTTVHSSGLRQNLGVIVVAIIKAAGPVIYTPPGDAELHAGDTLIALGRRADLDLLERLADPHPHREA